MSDLDDVLARHMKRRRDVLRTTLLGAAAAPVGGMVLSGAFGSDAYAVGTTSPATTTMPFTLPLTTMPTVSNVPEPASASLVAAGIAGAVLLSKRPRAGHPGNAAVQGADQIKPTDAA